MKYLNIKKFRLEPFQADFAYSQSPFPAYIGGWGTGKTLCLIARSLIYSELIPNNLGFIIRREFTDLQDSTIRDFENYTGMKVNSKREVAFPNGSVICFRHFEELVQAGAKGHKNLQNVNLGWAAIEQAEELETDRAFWLLFGRLRRALTASEDFEKTGLPLRSIFLIGNVAGDNWIKRFWKSGQIDRSELKGKFQLIEAQTHDNAHNLPEEFLANLEILKEKKPEMYQRYVMNDWSAEVDAAVFRGLDAIKGGGLFQLPDPVEPEVEYAIGIDLAKTQDFNVVAVINTRTKNFDYIARWNKTSWGITKERIKKIVDKFRNAHCFVDATGVGDPIVEDLQRAGISIYCEKDKEHSGIKLNNTNKMQMIERYAVAIQEKMISWPDPEDLTEKEAELMRTWIQEHKLFKAELTATRKIRYSAPEGEHDDCVMAGMLAVWGLFSELYDVYHAEEEKTGGEKFWDRVNADLTRQRIRNAGEDDEVEIMEEGARILE
jgi:hypothetical protein